MDPNLLFQHKNYIKPLVTKPANPYQGIKESFLRVSNIELTHQQICIILAQLCLETGHFRSCYNWNYGNIRCDFKISAFTMIPCSEIIAGKEIHYQPGQPESVFKAFVNEADAFDFYTKFISRTRYSAGLKGLLESSPENFIIGLRAGGYFTASLNVYLKTYLSIYNKLLEKGPQ